MQFFKVYPIEGPQGRIIENTDEGVIRERNNKKNDDDDKMVGTRAMGSQAVSKSSLLLEFHSMR